MDDHSDDWIDAARLDSPGTGGHRSYVGPPDQYDFMGATQFRLLTGLGLREDHHLLDLGCGSLRAGRLLMFYLRPGRYHGIEPNGWLIDDARAREIGADAFALRRPRFDDNAAMRMDVFGRGFDFIVAQSVFSHTGGEMLDRALANAAPVLNPGGQFLFTVLDESTPAWRVLAPGAGAEGWIYPDCVGFAREDVLARCARAGLSAEPLDWFHPRQRWYRAVPQGTPLLTPEQRALLGTGAVLFDPRFPTDNLPRTPA